jgi:hypothetical protein
MECTERYIDTSKKNNHTNHGITLPGAISKMAVREQRSKIPVPIYRLDSPVEFLTQGLRKELLDGNIEFLREDHRQTWIDVVLEFLLAQNELYSKRVR